MRLGAILTYKAARHPGGEVTVSDKFLAEMQAYADRWPGPLDVYIGLTDTSDEVLGSSMLPQPTEALRFHTFEANTFGFDVIEQLPDVLLTAIDAPLHLVPKRCRDIPTAAVMAVEYTFKTRTKQIMAERQDLKGRLGGMKWNLTQEAHIVGAARAASGIQANGYAAYNYYRRFNSNTIVYLDNRAYESEMPTVQQVSERIENTFSAKQPLRLAFTGRLEARKGPLETVALASELTRRGVDYSFFVAGDGPQREELERAVSAAGLQERFDIAGVLDFVTELMPRMRTEADVFFCPHPQGDPSCTYVETLACGVPIVGYANESVSTLAEHTIGVGQVPMGDASAAADAVLALAATPASLRRASHAALGFARAHSFEREYDARVEHFLSLVP